MVLEAEDIPAADILDRLGYNLDKDTIEYLHNLGIPLPISVGENEYATPLTQGKINGLSHDVQSKIVDALTAIKRGKPLEGRSFKHRKFNPPEYKFDTVRFFLVYKRNPVDIDREFPVALVVVRSDFKAIDHFPLNEAPYGLLHVHKGLERGLGEARENFKILNVFARQEIDDD